MSNSPSPFGQPFPGLPIREGTPPLLRPTKEEIATFPGEAKVVLAEIWAAQKSLIDFGHYDLSWIGGRHILLAGGTSGLGRAFASAVLGMNTAASVTILARDLKRSLQFKVGKAMQAQAEQAGMAERVHWSNDGITLEGKPLENLITTLKSVGADQVVYFNTIAAALSGLLPGMPPVYIKDVDENGLFQWQLLPLSEKEISITRTVMGEITIQFPSVLEENGIGVEASVFADWRGSLDKISRDPSQREYGRQGAYSTSLYLPKEIIQQAVLEAYGTSRKMMGIFYPMMRTRALSLIPGGQTVTSVNEKLMQMDSVRHIDIPELALMALDYVGKSLTEGYDNPFPRTDQHDIHLDEWMFEVVARINDDESSDFYYKRWMD